MRMYVGISLMALGCSTGSHHEGVSQSLSSGGARTSSSTLRSVAQEGGADAQAWFKRVMRMTTIDYNKELCEGSSPDGSTVPQGAYKLCLSVIDQECGECQNPVAGAPVDPSCARKCQSQQTKEQACSLRATNECKVVDWLEQDYDKYYYCAPFFINPGGDKAIPKAELGLLMGRWPAQFTDVVPQEGHLGRLSRSVIQQIANDIQTQGDQSPFIAEHYPDIETSCPGYPNMDIPEKVGFFTYVMEILAYNETSCKPDDVNNSKAVPHPPAVGLLQMENAKALRQGRGPNCSEPKAAVISGTRVIGSTAGTIMDPDLTVSCAVDILGTILKHKQHLFGFYENGKLEGSYWESLNPVPKLPPAVQEHKPGGKFRRDLCWYPLCYLDKNGKIDEAARQRNCSVTPYPEF